MSVQTVGDGILEVLRAYGVEYIFSSPGSEWPPLWDALARAKTLGLGPIFLNTRHEELAVNLAAGYQRHARKLPAVVLHSAVGPLKAAMCLRLAQHENTPMVILTGDCAGFGEMPCPDPGAQWLRSLAQVGGVASQVRPFVKRAATVTSPELLFGMIEDSCRLALTPPLGPVFLSIPGEYLLADCPPFKGRFTPPPNRVLADPQDLQHLAQLLVEAEHPLLITEYAGRDPENVALLVGLAEKLAAPVVEFNTPAFLNFPRDNALHQGFQPGELLDQADLVLAVGNKMPWYPPSKRPANARVVVIDEDAAQELLPYWALGLDQIIGGNLTSSLRQLNKFVDQVRAASGRDEGFYQERREFWQRRHHEQQENWRAAGERSGQDGTLDGFKAALAIGQTLPPDAILFEEVTSHKGLVLRHVNRNMAGTYYCRNSGGLGVGVGMALGIKVAAPERLVVAVVGDGALNYGPVLASFGFAQQFAVPIVVVVFNNQGYGSMKTMHKSYYPDGWSVRTNIFFGTEIEPRPDYAGIARCFGGCGEEVADPEALPGAIQRAIKHAEGGQLALLDVLLDG